MPKICQFTRKFLWIPVHPSIHPFIHPSLYPQFFLNRAPPAFSTLGFQVYYYIIEAPDTPWIVKLEDYNAGLAATIFMLFRKA